MKRTSLRWTFFVTLLLFAVPLYADQAVNINTADKAVLMTLTGIGEVKAQAIIDYRNANGPFSKIEDIMNVSGIGTATFNNIKDHITVESISVPNTTEPQVQETQPPLQIQPEQGGGAAPTPRLAVRITGENRSIVGAGSFWGGEAYGIDDEPLGQGIRYLWNFGDGATVEGRRVFHAYAYPGKYAVLLTVAQGYSSASNLIAVEAVLEYFRSRGRGRAIFPACHKDSGHSRCRSPIPEWHAGNERDGWREFALARGEGECSAEISEFRVR
ncbi:MAG: uptake protein [Candidatus Adlerbacteria bacterium GW2011_GWA2_54_12]|nr:MAG: uptake protein [Candidatus Adlerbacteria bacterium GW2011_GWA2_54_12]